jgi:hypothetical protein
MKFHKKKAWLFTMLLLATCVTAEGQSAMGESASGAVTDDAMARREGLAFPAAGSFWESSSQMGTTVNLASALRSGDDLWLGLTLRGQILPSPFSFPQSGRRHVLSSPLVPGPSSSDGQSGAPPSNKKMLTSSSGNPDSLSRVKFWALQGVMFAMLAVSVETTHRCLDAGSCTGIPTPFQSRSAMLGVGVPVTAGIAILSYEMKKHDNHWWFLPPAIVIGAETALTIHGVRASD